jgi:hypothetical protein
MKTKNSKSLQVPVDKASDWNHQDRIRQRAYELWEACGCPQGCEKEHWLQAEREILALIGNPPAKY